MRIPLLDLKAQYASIKDEVLAADLPIFILKVMSKFSKGMDLALKMYCLR